MIGCAITFVSVKNPLSKFVFVSILAISTFGFFESEQKTVAGDISATTGERIVWAQTEVSVKQIGDRVEKSKSKSDSEDDFSFEFPNIFHVFRSLF